MYILDTLDMFPGSKIIKECKRSSVLDAGDKIVKIHTREDTFRDEVSNLISVNHPLKPRYLSSYKQGEVFVTEMEKIEGDILNLANSFMSPKQREQVILDNKRFRSDISNIRGESPVDVVSYHENIMQSSFFKDVKPFINLITRGS